MIVIGPGANARVFRWLPHSTLEQHSTGGGDHNPLAQALVRGWSHAALVWERRVSRPLFGLKARSKSRPCCTGLNQLTPFPEKPIEGPT